MNDIKLAVRLSISTIELESNLFDALTITPPAGPYPTIATSHSVLSFLLFLLPLLLVP